MRERERQRERQTETERETDRQRQRERAWGHRLAFRHNSHCKRTSAKNG